MGAAAQPVQHRIPVVPPAWHDAGHSPLPPLLLASCLGPTMARSGSARRSSSGFHWAQIWIQGIQGGGGSEPGTAAPRKGSFDPARARTMMRDDGRESLSATAAPLVLAPALAQTPSQRSTPSPLLLELEGSKSPCFTCLTPAQTPTCMPDGPAGTSQGSQHLCPCQAGAVESPPPVLSPSWTEMSPSWSALTPSSCSVIVAAGKEIRGLCWGVPTPHISGSLALRGLCGHATSIPHHSLMLLWQDRWGKCVHSQGSSLPPLLHHLMGQKTQLTS